MKKSSRVMDVFMTIFISVISEVQGCIQIDKLYTLNTGSFGTLIIPLRNHKIPCSSVKRKQVYYCNQGCYKVRMKIKDGEEPRPTGEPLK